MYQDMDEPIEVVVLFQNNKMKPSRFRWNGTVYKIAEVTGDWKTDVGAYRIRHFAVVDSSSNFFQLSYDERKTSWVISKIWVE
ncbi:MAG: DUF6504 family protein [candidate division Zixibacteria bacterium]